MIWMMLILAVVFGGQPGARNAKGNELFQQKNYDEALAAYQEAQADEPDNPALNYNIGNTLYRQEKYPEAIQAYKKALGSEKPLSNQAYYNLGNSLYRLGQLKESIEAYKRGLRIQPDDTDMKYNLEFVQRQLQEQQDQEQKQDEQKDEQKDQDQKDQDQKQDDQKDQDQKDQDQKDQEQKEQQNEQQQQQPKDGELSREQAERLLNALNQDEQDLQKQLRRQGVVKQTDPEKDW